MQIDQWRNEHPEFFFLDPEEPEKLTAWLSHHKLLPGGEPIQNLETAGEGNMNCTLRAITRNGSFIVKQARPWVEKYPQFQAPWDRSQQEVSFYQTIATVSECADRMPKLLGYESANHLLLLQDLGRVADLTTAYESRTLGEKVLSEVAHYLAHLHLIQSDTSPRSTRMSNLEMRRLNRDHIFDLPLSRDAGPDLDAITKGLTPLANQLRSNEAFVKETAKLEKRYLADGPRLLHGDLFPGSLVQSDKGINVIDPEFSYFGDPEYDLGIFTGHLILITGGFDQSALFNHYYREISSHPIDEILTLQYAGIEIMRRLIGYAQLPLERSLEEKALLLNLSVQLVLSPDPGKLQVS